MSLGAIGGLQAGLGALQGLGSIASGIGAAKRAREAGNRAREAAELNAQLLEKLGFMAQAEQIRNGQLLLASQKLAFAVNGVNISTGSALDVALDTTVEAAVAGLRAKFGFESQAYQQRIEGLLAGFTAESTAANLQVSGIQQGTTTILGSGIRGLGIAEGLPEDAQ